VLRAKFIAFVIGALLSFAGQPLLADEALARSKNCLACHSVETKVVGPALKDIAAKYKGDSGAVAALSAKVKNGGSGVWGSMPMPPNALSDAEAEELVKWILSL
jgi:cytochrome c